MKKLLSVLMFIFFYIALFSQNDQKNPVNAMYDSAVYYMNAESYSKAAEILERLVKIKPDNYRFYLDLGYCYMFMNNKILKSIEILSKTYEHYKSIGKIHSSNGELAYYYLGEAFLRNYDFDTACTIFTNLIENGHNKKIKKLAEKSKEHCQTGKKYVLASFTMTLNPLYYANSKYPDHSPVVTLDGKYLYFTSRRPGSSEGNIADDGLPYEDIYYIDKKQEDPQPINLGPPVNTPEHEATCDISADGSELLIYKFNPKTKGDIYYSKKVNGQWTEPVRLPEPINSKYRESHASFSKDGRFLFFTSNRPGGFGGMDIYMAQRNSKGEWVNVKNLGPVINTKEDEEGPFLASDGKTLYFSSKGHENMGGYDVFKSVWQEDSTWSEPENLGFPISTVFDDVFFYPMQEKNMAYWSSKQMSGVPDLYEVALYEDETEVIIVRGHTFDKIFRRKALAKSNMIGDTIFYDDRKIYKPRQIFYKNNDSIFITYKDVKGDSVIISDSIYKIPFNTRIFDYNVATKQIIEIYNPARSTGKYAFAVSSQVKHLILFKAPYYIYDLIKLPNISQSIYYDAELDTMIKGQIRSEKYTEFDSETTDLNESQKLEFVILADFMQKYPWVWVELAAYQNENSAEPYDKQRLMTIANYLKSLGIDSVRIKFTYSDKPLQGDSIEYIITDIMPLIAENTEKPSPTVSIKHGVLVSDVNFEINQYQNPDIYPNLDILVDYLKANPSAKVAIYGYTDPQGPVNFNIYLAKKRAEFVKNYLLSKGINPNQIVAEGKGFSKEVARSKDLSGRYIWDALKYNRRVEIQVLKQGENQLLFVKPIQVPEKYKVQNTTYSYSIMLTTADKPLSKDKFNFNVIEIKAADGSYQYIYGSFETKEKAEEELNKVKENFPDAYIFINDLRK